MDAAALREFCHRERPPSVVMDNMFDCSQPPAADAIELDIGQEMTRSFGRVDCEAILSTGVVTVFRRGCCRTAPLRRYNGGNFDGRRIGARYCAGGAASATFGTTDHAAVRRQRRAPTTASRHRRRGRRRKIHGRCDAARGRAGGHDRRRR